MSLPQMGNAQHMISYTTPRQYTTGMLDNLNKKVYTLHMTSTSALSSPDTLTMMDGLHCKKCYSHQETRLWEDKPDVA